MVTAGNEELMSRPSLSGLISQTATGSGRDLCPTFIMVTSETPIG